MTSPAAEPPDVERLLAERAWLQALARSLVVDPATADDIAQDATVLALTKPPREQGALRGWLRRVVRNLAMNTRRGDVRRDAREARAAREGAAAGEDTADLVARWDVRRQVVDAVLALEEPYRTTLLLRFFEGLETAEVARRLGVPADTVKTRQRRAIDMLRARLAHLDDGKGRRGLAVLLVFTGEGARPGAVDATASIAASTAPAATSIVFGGLAMTALTKTLAVAAVLVAIGAAWWATRDDAATGDRAAATATSSDPQAAHGARPARTPRPGALPDETPGGAGKDSAAAPADIDPDRDVTGVVVDRDDHPVAGADVVANGPSSWRRAFAAWSGAPAPPDDVIDRTKTAADGSFRARLPVGTDALLRVSAPGYATLEVERVDPGKPLRLVLSPPMSIRVLVKDEGGAPVAGAPVLVNSYGVVRADARHVDPSSFSREGTTGADGVAAWDGLPRGRAMKVRVEVSANGGRIRAGADADIADRDVNEIVVTLAPGRTVEGRVVDGETQTGIAHAKITTPRGRAPIAETAVDGTFRIDGWAGASRWQGDERSQILVDADGYAPGWADVPGADAARPAPLVVALRRGFEITGTAARADGSAVPSARVIALAKDPRGHASKIVSATTGDGGAFRLGWFPRDERTVLLVVADGCAPATVVVAPPAKGETVRDVGTVVVGPGRAVRGRIVDEAGIAVGGRVVRLFAAKDDDEDERFAPYRRASDDGRFAFDDVAADRSRIVVFRDTDDEGPVRDALADVPSGPEPPPVTVVVHPPPPAPAGPPPKVVLKTRVVDEDGQPVAGVSFTVGFHAGGGGTGRLISGDGGVLDVPCSAEPQYVSTYAEGEAAARWLHRFVWLRPGQTSAEVVLRRAEPVTGTVVDAGGKPCAGAWVEALVGSRQVGFATADAQGRFAVGVPPGAVVDLEARPSSATYPPPPDVGERRGVTAGSSDVTMRVLPVAMDRSIDVVLVPPEGETPGPCTVSAAFHGANNARPVKADFDARGRARLEGLPRAPMRLRATYRRAGDDSSTYTGAILRIDAETTSVRLVVAKAREVRGSVVDAAGAPAPGAAVFSTAGFIGSSAVADAAGRFVLRVPGDAEAPFLVSATGMPYDRAAPRGGWEVVEDAAGAELVIVLRPMPPR